MKKEYARFLYHGVMVQYLIITCDAPYCLAVSIGSCSGEGDRRYCSRELMAGRDFEAATLSAADVFAFGLTLYELARGQEHGPLPDDGPLWDQVRGNHLRVSIHGA